MSLIARSFLSVIHRFGFKSGLALVPEGEFIIRLKPDKCIAPQDNSGLWGNGQRSFSVNGGRAGLPH